MNFKKYIIFSFKNNVILHFKLFMVVKEMLCSLVMYIEFNELPLIFALYFPFISSKMPHFWPLIFLVLPLFEMWQLCNSEHLINFFFSYLGNTYIFGKKYHHQSFIDFRYGLFSTQWPQYDAHILQRLVSKRFSCCSVEQCFFYLSYL